MKIVTTEHARNRMIQRNVCKKHKCDKLADKAWKNKSESKGLARIKKERNNEYIQYRELLGFIYVFNIYKDTIILVTVYKV